MEDVVKLSKEGHTAIVTLEEREYKNTFTLRLVNGLKEIFEKTIPQDPEIKVVIVQGYDQYFCCGGTKEGLLELTEGTGKEAGDAKARRFTDLNFHDLLLRCEVPVIAAMSGHTLGGGLAFGCYADILVMGEQCIYSANFLRYGFTPGLGATYIIPLKIGRLLGTEMLYNARNYFGAELKERGVTAKVVKKQEVFGAAMEIAKELAEKPALSLKALKKCLTKKIRLEIPDVIQEEVAMHQVTFTQTEVLGRIETLFGN